VTDIPDWNIVAAAVFGICVLYFALRMFYRPLKVVFRTLLCILLGGAAILLYNVVGSFWGLTIGFNVISAFIIGIMGLPGLGMLVALRYIFS